MALLAADIKLFKPANISDTTANGGVMTAVELTDVVGALFPNVDNAERLAGSSKWRKMFFKLTNADTLPLIASKLYMDSDTAGTDTILFAKGTTQDIQSAIPVNPTMYGAFALETPLSVGDTSLSVVIPEGVSSPFISPFELRITNKPTINDTGYEDFVTVTAVTPQGGSVLLTFTPAVANAYSPSNARVMSVCEIGDIQATVSNYVSSSDRGDLDITKITCTNKATIDSVWTLSFTSSVGYTLSSSIKGAMGDFNIMNTIAPTNSAVSAPYFTLPGSAFSGSFAIGTTINFTTNSASVPVWLNRIVPPGSSPIALNKAVFCLDGGTIG